MNRWRVVDVGEWADELEMVLAVALRNMDRLGYPPVTPTVDGRVMGD